MTALLERLVLRWSDAAIEMAFRLIPAGSFFMGSRGYHYHEEPIHEVQITHAFWMAETPVTQAQFARWTQAEASGHRNRFEGHPNHPAENMEWYDALRFCAWLTQDKASDLPPGFTAALPTEAEWEYACRARTDTEYYTGDGEGALRRAGWFEEGFESGATHPVREKKKPNAWELFDLHGNVWEWCHDPWEELAYRHRLRGAPDPGYLQRAEEHASGRLAERSETPFRVFRGGSWGDSARFCRSAYRFRGRSAYGYRNIGFRVCLVLGPVARAEAVAERAELTSTLPPAQREKF